MVTREPRGNAQWRRADGQVKRHAHRASGVVARSHLLLAVPKKCEDIGERGLEVHLDGLADAHRKGSNGLKRREDEGDLDVLEAGAEGVEKDAHPRLHTRVVTQHRVDVGEGNLK